MIDIKQLGRMNKVLNARMGDGQNDVQRITVRTPSGTFVLELTDDALSISTERMNDAMRVAPINCGRVNLYTIEDGFGR